ncbi:uncharacterized protein LOC132295947 [Cornus florida]|uniref:uncharacterized protein LOC132295947 n=1 Tax=Cornus florida TaxID=4283 RepID=UPI0028987FB8|nr:uncharacterized protein LOC132295947 [Cornus florida]
MKRTVSEVEKVSEQNTKASTLKIIPTTAEEETGPNTMQECRKRNNLITFKPIGPGSGTYTNYLGTLARNGKLAPLCYKTWWEMSKQLKEDIWNIVNGHYPPSEKKWREYKCELKNEYYSVSDTDAERLANSPPDVEKEHWEFLVRHWGTPMAKEVSEKNRERHGKQTMMHTTGTKSFARISTEIEENEGIQLSRADLFFRTHINKDGKATDAAISEMITIARVKTVANRQYVCRVR